MDRAILPAGHGLADSSRVELVACDNSKRSILETSVIISHQHQFIFFAVPKTGTHSIRQALRPHLAEHDQEQVGLFVQRTFPQPELAAIGHGHVSVAQVKPVLGDEVFNRYFKFAFVRNPWDRFVSYCAFISRDTGRFENDPHGFMREMVYSPRPLQHLLYQPQNEMLSDERGELAMDFVGRVEQMERDHITICRRLGVEPQPIEQINSSQHKPYTDYYNNDLRALIAHKYARDIELFDYRFGV